MSVTVRVKRLPHGTGLPLPSYQSKDAAGLDVVAGVPEGTPVELLPSARALVPTGFALELPPGYEAQIRPRSGLALKHGVTLVNSPGLIDPGYRGEVRVLLHNTDLTSEFRLAAGDRVAQLILVPIASASPLESDSLDSTVRGSGGFGSTGA